MAIVFPSEDRSKAQPKLSSVELLFIARLVWIQLSDLVVGDRVGSVVGLLVGWLVSKESLHERSSSKRT